jgi:hypothetical protein
MASFRVCLQQCNRTVALGNFYCVDMSVNASLVRRWALAVSSIRCARPQLQVFAAYSWEHLSPDKLLFARASRSPELKMPHDAASTSPSA